MSDPIVVLPEDTTGLLPVCKIQGERHSPLPGSTRLLLPNFGAFYAESLRVYNPTTNEPVSPTLYECVDLWQEASERSGKDVFNTVLITSALAPAEVAIDYQAFGGPHSRNAADLVAWLIARRQETAGAQDYRELTDLPRNFEPSHHLHLLKHVYGMDTVIKALGNVQKALAVGPEGAWQEALFTIDQSLARLKINAGVTIESLVINKYNEWKTGVSLFNLSLDLVRNYPPLSDAGFEAALGSFATPDPVDDRYVNVLGLGGFAKGLVERCVMAADTGLDQPFAVLNAPTRGSVFAARVGATFTLPTPAVAATLLDAQLSVYPKNYPDTNQFVVHKLAGNERDAGCILMGFNPVTGEAYLGMLALASCREPLVWKRFYFQGDLTQLESLLEAHVVTNNDPHDLTKDQIQLGFMENLPITTVDDILARTGTRKFVTMDVLMYHMRAFMENAILPKSTDGLVDLNANPMNDAKIVFAPYKDSGKGYDAAGKEIPPKGQFISSFCDGSDKYTRSTDGTGSFIDTLTQPDSDDCKFYNVPKHGDVLGDFCEGVNKKTKYADGKGGSYTELVHANSPDCGYVAPAKAGEVIATFCSGVNQMVRYADGKSGFYDMPSMINTYLCGGTIFPAGMDASLPGTKPSAIVINLASTNALLYAGTKEVLSINFTGLTPSVSYNAVAWIKSPALQDNADFKTMEFTFTAGTDGTYSKEVTTTDDGSTVPRGVYDNWIAIPSEKKESNHITRTFMAGTDPGGVPVTQPPVFAPEINYSTDTLLISAGTNESQTTIVKGFVPATDYTLNFWSQSPAVNNNLPSKEASIPFTTDSQGSFTNVRNIYDNGSQARGDYTCWAAIDTTLSNNITRQLVIASGGTGYKYDPKIVYTASLATIKPGDTELQTYVMTGFEKNKNYTVVWKIAPASSGNPPIVGTAFTMVVTTDANGYYRFEKSSIDDGTVPRDDYQCWLQVSEVSLSSNTVWRKFIAGVVVTPKIPKLVYSVSPMITTPGTVETHTVTLTDFPPNSNPVLDFWIRSVVWNNNADYKTKTVAATVDANGAGVYTLVTVDDNTAPRGDYTCWINSAVAGVSSPAIVRSAIAGATAPPVTQPPTLANAKIVFSTDHPTITVGAVETFTVTLTAFIPNTSYNVEFWGSGAALNNGGQAIKTYTGQITVNSAGNGTFTMTNPPDDGVTVPRGEYRSWIVVSTITSNIVIRTFTGTPKPVIVYNPVIVYTTSTTNITAGTTEYIKATFTGFLPNTSYPLQGWVQSSSYNGNAPFKTTDATIVTDATGAAVFNYTAYDDGVTVPRGAYTCWFTVPTIPVSSNAVVRYFTGTPAPTAPPYNPAISFWSNTSSATIGQVITYYKSISGLLPNTTYTIASWGSHPFYNGGQAFNISNETITTNANGVGSSTASVTDNGTAPRGTWTQWAIINGTNASSGAFTTFYY